ncbi:sensor histidine kinase [Streptomyces sp. MST-110588]|uniref:sensor histidine kinase n=1 Tax=Streptomyces sp. MST-110588 TaxID=2833628 RepID=UPI001F5D8D7E|nr:sensor histidine kinase [Streptomyces sp. MST-110588]UNO38349.1 sensor domain-containing protein [Streptomyces sp. MST-110588]UNO43603.1 sensor domain-containing protein [Streptomyces sp. MST-110588]
MDPKAGGRRGEDRSGPAAGGGGPVVTARGRVAGPAAGGGGAGRLRWCARGLVVAVLSQIGSVALFTVTVLTLLALAVGVGVLILPVVVAAVRALAGYHRRTAGEWTGTLIETPYRHLVEAAPHDVSASLRQCRRLLSDPATWRDVLWLFLDGPLGLILGLLPASLVAYGLNGLLVTPVLWEDMGPHWGFGVIWPIADQTDACLAMPQGAALVALGLLSAGPLVRTHGRFSRLLLAPTRSARLTLRVERLTETRLQTVQSQAAELRRIERDLHDGAQARLVSLGMKLGLADTLLEEDPEMVRTLLADAMDSSSQALTELRELVRGIHPPVLAERGLHGAVRALAVGLPLPVELAIDLPFRPQPPVESAAYFVIAETLANVTKHSGASRVGVRLWYADGVLQACVTDDGRGGADPEGGSGLRGLQRRLAAFDGVLEVHSPQGGPTVVRMELPCAW